jgi:hypothetical protein
MYTNISYVYENKITFVHTYHIWTQICIYMKFFFFLTRLFVSERAKRSKQLSFLLNYALNLWTRQGTWAGSTFKNNMENIVKCGSD